MLNKKIKTWLRAIRPFSLTGSVIPVTLGAVLSIRYNRFQFGYFILSVFAIVLLQAAVNLLSDHDDFKNKVDTKDSYGSSGVILENLLSPKQVRNGGMICLLVGCLIGLLLFYEKGMMILILGMIGALGGYSYTGKPLQLKYIGLGAPLVFLLFGPLMVIGSYYVQMQSISLGAFYVSIPVGLLTTAILHANDIRDIQYDKNAGIKTLSMMVGRNNSIKIYYGMIVLSYLSILVMTFYSVLPIWSLFCFITIPAAYTNFKILFHADEVTSGLVNLDKLTGKLQAQFGLVLIISILPSLLIR